MNIEQGRISGQQLMFMIAGFIQGSILLISFTTDITKHDTWLVVLSGMVVTAPFAVSYALLARRFRGQNLIQINRSVFGRYLGLLISFYYMSFYISVLAYNINDLGGRYAVFVMPDIPKTIVIAIFTLVCMYAVAHGPEPLARISHLLVAIALIIIAGSILLLVRDMKLANFLPMFEISLREFVKGTHIISAIPLGEMIVFLTVMNSLSDDKHTVRYTLFGYLIGGLSLLAVSLRNTAVVGDVEPIVLSPSFQSTRLIDIGTVFTRMDVVVGGGTGIPV